MIKAVQVTKHDNTNIGKGQLPPFTYTDKGIKGFDNWKSEV